MAYTTVNKAKDHFNSVTYTGNGSSPRSITGVGFRPDLVWTKDRSDTSTQPWHDVVRGATYAIRSDNTSANENTPAYGYINAFDSDGYTMQQGSSDFGRFNDNSNSYVSFNWKAGNSSGSSNSDGSITSTVSANTTAGFSIISYTGTGSAETIGHGLGAVPKFIIVKRLNSTGPWTCHHTSIGNAKSILLNSDAGEYNSGNWNSTDHTSSVINLGTGGVDANISGATYIAYAFAEIQGYSKFGSYVGNNNTNGPFIYTGFRPSFVVIKRQAGTKDWFVWDSATSPRNPTNAYGRPNKTTAWGSYDWLDLVSNGIKIRNTSDGASANGESYIYWACGQSLVGSNNVPSTAR